MKSMIISSLLMDYVAPLFPVYQGDRLLSAICCGVLSGLGYAMIYMRDSSTGGSDFIMMSIKALNPHLSLGNIAFALDAVIVILGTVIVSRDVDSLIYGLIVSYLLSLVMDKVMYGIDEGKLALIVTDPEHSTEICFKIDEVLGRGSTILNGMGSYSKDDKHIIMCACNNKEMYLVEQAVKEKEKGGGGKTSAEPAEAQEDGDELLPAAVEVVLETGQASVSMLQRRLKLGYSRAARLVDQMEERGIVGPFEGSKPRQLLIDKAKWQELQMSKQPQPEPEIDRSGSIRDVFESRDALE